MCHVIRTCLPLLVLLVFHFPDPAHTDIYTLSLHDALPICRCSPNSVVSRFLCIRTQPEVTPIRSLSKTGRCALPALGDRKSTRLNSSHQIISYAVFCWKKKVIQDSNSSRMYLTRCI